MRVIGEGESSRVFEMAEGRVVKAYKRRLYSSIARAVSADDELLSRVYFHFEVHCYKLAHLDKRARHLVPEFYGVADPLEVVQPPAESRDLLQGCGLVLQRIKGMALKGSELRGDDQLRFENALNVLRSIAGMQYVDDASCFMLDGTQQIVVIDFGTWEGFFEFEEELIETGKFSVSSRQKLLTIIEKL